MCFDGGVVLRAMWDTRWKPRGVDGVPDDDKSDVGARDVWTIAAKTD